MTPENCRLSKANPAIVVVGFNRPKSIQRLLDSLTTAHFEAPVQLVISIDRSSSVENEKVIAVAKGFAWPHGEKRIILHEQNLGLRQHILNCGDLTAQYGSVIVLEDDLTVAKDFYRYATQALKFVDSHEEIAGVSLYSHATNVVARFPFVPLYDGYDNFYLQFASSWGQAWSTAQWEKFRHWYAQLSNVNDQPIDLENFRSTNLTASPIPSDVPIPPNVLSWSNSSWLKYFIWYMVETNRYFLYPRHSMTTNYNECGTHSTRLSPIWQVPLAQRVEHWRFSLLSESLAVYDVFFELLPDRLRRCTTLFNDYDFDVDLYGMKPMHLLKQPFVLTSKCHRGEPIKSFDLVRKPLEANFDSEISVCQRAMFSLTKPQHLKQQIRLSFDSLSVVEYFYGLISLRTLAMNLIRYLWQKRVG